MDEIKQKIIELTSVDTFDEAQKIEDDDVFTAKTLTILGSDKIIKYKVMDQDEIYVTEFVLQME